MILFPVYAVFVWYLCLRWRRTWVGWASLFMGVAAVGVLAWFHQTLSRLISSDMDGPLFPLQGSLARPVRRRGSRSRSCSARSARRARASGAFEATIRSSRRLR